MDGEYRKFIQKCRDTGADGVIGIKTMFTTYGYETIYRDVVIQGTTIRLKN